MSALTRLYPKAAAQTMRFTKKRPFLAAVTKNFLLLQLLFLSLFAWVFGSLYQQGSHTHNLKVAFVDYDAGGAVGEAVRVAYASLRAETFPTLVERNTDDFPAPADLETSVCQTNYWAALYVSPGASARLHDALGGGPPALAFDPTNVLGYIWNEALYPLVVDVAINGTLQTLSEAARVAYSTANGTGQVTSASSPEAIAVLVRPWVLRQTNIKPTTQGSRAIYNTIVIILILIQEFFYLGTINGLYASFKIYTRVHPSRIILVRNVNSLAYTLCGSLCVTGAIWAFRSGWDLNGNQFALCWAAFWLFAHTNFLVLDVLTIWLPPVYIPMSLITWIITNVSSILLPFPLSPGFYHIGYLFPAHEVYQVLLDIWTGGCNPQLRVALPVLFAWEVAALALSSLGVYRRAHQACAAEQAAKKAFNERLEAALKFEREREHEIREADAEEAAAAAGTATTTTSDITAAPTTTKHDAEKAALERQRRKSAAPIAGRLSTTPSSTTTTEEEGEEAEADLEAAPTAATAASASASRVRSQLAQIISREDRQEQRAHAGGQSAFAFRVPFGDTETDTDSEQG